MGLIVQKFGGTSVANAERIHRAAKRAIATKERGNQVVVVVSAMGDSTDDLIDLAKQVVSTFVLAGLNVPEEDGGLGVTGFANPDNLAEGPDGRLWIVEDNVPSDIWVADKDLNGDGAADAVHLFASMVDPNAEGTGIYFGQEPNVLFVNVQHAAKAQADGTWAIVKD